MKKHIGKLCAAAVVLIGIAAAVISALGKTVEAPAPTPIPLAAATAVPTATPEPPTYTLNLAVSEFPANWNPHRLETSQDAQLCACLSAGLYAYDLNKSSDGFRLAPCMAADMPTDITAELIGSFGLVEGDAHRAYAIPLREELCWQDGTPILAADFAESARRLLDPAARNPRASLFCDGPFQLAGAARYRDQSLPIYLENATHARYTMEDLSPNEDGVYCTPDGQTVSLALDYPLEFLLYGDTLLFYVETYGASCFDLRTLDSLLSRMDEDGLIPLTDDSYLLFDGLTTGNPTWGDSEETLPDYFVYHAPAPPVDWAEVGIFARGEHELVLVLAQPLEGFELLDALTASWLVNTELYDACTGEEDGHYANSYGTSPESTLSCGPYILCEYEENSFCYLTRNPLFFETETEYERPIYQTTDIVIEYVPDADEQLERFLSGKLDLCQLTDAARDEYAQSPYLHGIPGDTSYLMVFNPDPEALARQQEAAGEGVNKTILTLSDFRKAMGLALDREAFCQALSPANIPSLALFTPLIIFDPSSGIPYRSTEQGKAVISDLWGDAALTGGYDPEAAGELFDRAWETALQTGLLREDDTVELCIGLPSDAEYYEKGYELLEAQFTEAVEGTQLEGRLRFTKLENLGSDCYAALKDNRVDLLFGVGWAGSALDPHGLMEAYLSDDYRYDASWNTETVRLTVAIHGESYTASVMDWYEIMCGGTRS